MDKRNIRLLMEYDGTNYSGWQIQSSEVRSQSHSVCTQADSRLGRVAEETPRRTTRRGGKSEVSTGDVITIQGILQEKIKLITGKDAKLLSASRTDAGVHALGQVASFKTDSSLEPKVLKRALNAVLPEDIRILAADEADMKFHPRYDASGKSYFYIIDNTGTASAFLYRYAWRLPYKVDLKLMKEAGMLLTGRHDFSAFRGSGCGAKSTERNVSFLSVEQINRIDFMTSGVPGNFIKIRIEADAFLRHMVRNIVGTLVEAGRGRMTMDALSEAIRLKDRKKTGPTAPANGLFLERVVY